MLARTGRMNRPAFTRLSLSGVAAAALAATLSVPVLADTPAALLQSQAQVQPDNPAMMCVTDQQPDTILSKSRSTLSMAHGDIDDTKNIEKQRVWIYHGLTDRIVNANLTRAAEKFYLDQKVPAANIKYVERPIAGHSFASPLSKDKCGLTQFPYMVDCDGYSAAEDLLTFLYPDQKNLKPAPAPAPAPAQGKLWQFKQTAYTKGMEFTSMDDTAWMYVPKSCEADASKCKLHVAFHGCQQSQSFANDGDVFGMRFVTGAGYNEWAEAARVLVLYPQAKPTGGTLDSMLNLMLMDAYKVNPESCWDFWGYTEKSAPIYQKFATRSAPQMKAVKAMIDDLLKPSQN